MLAPSASDEGGGKKVLIWASVAGVGLLSAAAVAVAFIMRPAPAPAASGVGTAPAVAAVAAPAAAPKAGADEEDGDEAPSEGELAAKRAKAGSDDGKDDEGSSDRGSSSRRSTSRRSGSDDGPSKQAEPSAKSDPEPAAKSAPAKSSGPRTIDDLLDGALGGGSKPASKAAAAEPKSNLPDQPTKSDVVNAMKGVQGQVSSCAKGQTGVAFVNVSIAGATGRVTSAEVTGITGPAGSCIAKAVRGAQFPKFQQKVFKVKYPFKL
jgi:hypothetical protein